MLDGIDVLCIQLTMAIEFEWDENKNRNNIEKHGIDFSDAISAFDYHYLQRIDDRFEYGETRYILLGRLNDGTIVLVYTKRHDQIRIISARQANKNERKAYQEIQDRLGSLRSDG